MTLIRASATGLTVLLCLTILATVTPLPTNAYYGYPAPRHSDKVAHEATSVIVALGILKSWLRGLGEPTTPLASNLSPTELGNVMLRKVTSPSKYALLIGGLQLKALKVLAGLSPTVSAEDVVKAINASINYMVSQGIVNSSKTMWDAITDRASCQVALNYVALSVARVSQGNSSTALKALTAIAAFQEALATHHYRYAHSIMRETAENTSLIAAAYMTCQLPPKAISEGGQPPNIGAPQVSSGVTVNAEDILKAVAVLERLGPKAVEILSKVPVSAVIGAVSKVPLSALRNMSVDEIVKAIETAASSGETFNLNAFTVSPNEAQGAPQSPGGQGTPNVGTSTAHEERSPIPKHWVRPQLTNPFQVSEESRTPSVGQSASSANYAASPVVSALVEVVKSVSLPTPPTYPVSTKWWSLTLAEGGVHTVAGAGSSVIISSPYLVSLLTPFLAVAVLAALILTLRTRQRYVTVKPVRKVTVGELPPVVREFWDAVALASRISSVELRANLTHREIVSKILRNLREDAGVALLRLTILYEGVRYAGVKVTRELSIKAQELLQEVRTLLETK